MCVCVYDNLIDGVMGHNYAFMTKGEFVIVTCVYCNTFMFLLVCTGRFFWCQSGAKKLATYAPGHDHFTDLRSDCGHATYLKEWNC